jgi:hypothetical protein
MCTSIVFNGKQTLIGFNFDNPGLKYHVVKKNKAFYISLLVNDHLWEPCFGCNSRGDFLCLPALNPGVKASAYPGEGDYRFLDRENLKVLLEQTTFADLEKLVVQYPFYNEAGFSLQAQDSDKDGNVVQIFPGLGYKILAKPAYSVLTNFQLMTKENIHHPWAGVDRYEKANAVLAEAKDTFSAQDMMALLKEVAQTSGGAPTAVSIVFVPEEKRILYVENQHWDSVLEHRFLSEH